MILHLLYLYYRHYNPEASFMWEKIYNGVNTEYNHSSYYGVFFSILIFFQWFNLYKVAKVDSRFRVFLMFLDKTIAQIFPFLFFLSITLMAINDVLYYKEITANGGSLDEIVQADVGSTNEQYPNQYVKHVAMQLRVLVFSDFTDVVDKYDTIGVLIFLAGSIFMAIILLNLLIAIISEAYEDVMKSLSLHENYELCEYLLDLETTLWVKEFNMFYEQEGFLFMAE